MSDEALTGEQEPEPPADDEDAGRPSRRSRAALPPGALALSLLAASPSLLAIIGSPWAELLFLGGLLLALFCGIAAHALLQFSPARLLQRLEKRFADQEDGEARLEEIEEELDRAEEYTPSLWLLQLAGLGASLYSILASDAHPLWFGGTLGFVLLFLLAVLLTAYVPDRLASTRAEPIVWGLLPVVRALHWISWPVTKPLHLVALFVVRNLLGLRSQDENGVEGEDLADEIRAAVEDKDENESLADEAKDWIENIVDFKDEDVAGVMTPRTDIVAIDAEKNFREAVRQAVDAGHSRLPVFEETLDNIVGIFYLRDAIKVMAAEDASRLTDPVTQHVREAYFVPESKAIGDLFREFKSRRLHIAIVVDEYGGTSGVVSLEDVIEEIVGEIVDEYDEEEEPTLRVVEKGKTLEVDARIHVSDLNEELSVEVPESDDYETIGGWVFSHLGRIPQTGDRFETEQLEITILAADPRRIERLRVKVLDREKTQA